MVFWNFCPSKWSLLWVARKYATQVSIPPCSNKIRSVALLLLVRACSSLAPIPLGKFWWTHSRSRCDNNTLTEASIIPSLDMAADCMLWTVVEDVRFCICRGTAVRFCTLSRHTTDVRFCTLSQHTTDVRFCTLSRHTTDVRFYALSRTRGIPRYKIYTLSRHATDVRFYLLGYKCPNFFTLREKSLNPCDPALLIG